MRYFIDTDNSVFYKEPESFNKYTPKNLLRYAICANMYVPGIKTNLFDKLINNSFQELGSIIICLEDAIAEKDVAKAEQNVLNLLEQLSNYNMSNNISNNIPLIFVRVRNIEQFKRFSNMLTKNHISSLCGFNFPKFNSTNGNEYFQILKDLSTKYQEILYGVPILEDKSLIYKESRFSELNFISQVLSDYDDYALSMSVGCSDFSSYFGLRRDVNNTIYDIKVVSDCLSDIANYFLRSSRDYIISGPVWEYFSNDENSLEVAGLIKELNLDMENGFYGKLVIHPSQIKIINKRYVVKYHDYMDAEKILNCDGGAFRSYKGNRMNESPPHLNWAKKIMSRTKIFGVLKDGVSL